MHGKEATIDDDPVRKGKNREGICDAFVAFPKGNTETDT